MICLSTVTTATPRWGRSHWPSATTWADHQAAPSTPRTSATSSASSYMEFCTVEGNCHSDAAINCIDFRQTRLLTYSKQELLKELRWDAAYFILLFYWFWLMLILLLSNRLFWIPQSGSWIPSSLSADKWPVLYPQQGSLAGAYVLQLPAAGETGRPRRCRWQQARCSATGTVENRGGAMAVGSVGGRTVHCTVQTPNTAGPSSGHLPDHWR